VSSSDDSSSDREGDTASRSEEKTIRRRFASDLMSASSSAISSFSIGRSAHLGRLPVRGSLDLEHNLSTASPSSLLQGFLLLLQPLAAVTHSFIAITAPTATY
jgi:hypothetical protein